MSSPQVTWDAPSQVKWDDEPQGSAATRFGQGAMEGAKNVVKGQIAGYKSGGFLNSPETGSAEDLAKGVTQTFNPFHPISTAGYLVPQPVKDIYQKMKGGDVAGGLGQATAEAAPYATAPFGAAPIRGAAKATNAVMEHAPQVGTLAGLAGAGEELANGNWHGMLYMPYLGGKVGKMVQQLPRVPEDFGQGTPTQYEANTGIFPKPAQPPPVTPQGAATIPTPKPAFGQYQRPAPRVPQAPSSVPGPRITENVPIGGGFSDVRDDAAMMQSIESQEGSDLAPAPAVNWQNPWGFESQLAQSTERMQPTSDLGQQAFQEALRENMARNKVEASKKGLK